MPRPGRPTVEITLSAAERRRLESWARRRSSAQALALRCRIVLACADPELSRQQIADRSAATRPRSRSGGNGLLVTVSTGRSMNLVPERLAASVTT